MLCSECDDPVEELEAALNCVVSHLVFLAPLQDLLPHVRCLGRLEINHLENRVAFFFHLGDDYLSQGCFMRGKK